MSEIRDYLRSHIEAFATLAKLHGIERPRPDGYRFVSPEELIVAHGMDFVGAPLPSRYERGVPGQCFMNALLLALHHPELTYVEGYGSTIVMPVHHAWCVDPDGNVIDPTWDLPEERTYLGVQVSTVVAELIAHETGYYGILGNPSDRLDAILKSGVIA